MRREYSAKEDSSRDESSRGGGVQTVEFGESDSEERGGERRGIKRGKQGEAAGRAK